MSKNVNINNLRVAMIGHKVVPSRRGGIETVLTTLCPILVSKGHTVCCYNRSGEEAGGEFFGDVKDGQYKGVSFKKVWTIKKKGLSALTSSFFASIRAAFGKYDIVHYHAEGPCVMLWIPKMFGKKCVATVHGLDWKREKWSNGFASKYIKLGERVLARYADEIIVLSEEAKKYFMDTYHRDTTVIPNGVSRPDVRQPNLIKERYGLNKNSYFCTLARLTEEKGIHYLIEAYKKIKTDKKLVIAGDSSDTDDYVKRLKDLAGGDPNIIFTGFVSGDMLDEIYSNAYVYVLPSNLEGMPMSLLEAMSYSCCCVVSDIPEMTSVIGDMAVVFKRGDINDLALKLQQLDDSPQTVLKYKSGSADYICKKYNWQDIADSTILLYKGMIKES